MIKLALTGSIGMGKSTVAAMFERAGVPVFDADAVVRSLQGPGGALVERIGERFPGTVKGGVLDRERLSRVVLEDPPELAALEAIVHPAVQDARQAFLDKHRDAPALLFDIPLLFETGGEASFDKVIVVSAPAEAQRARVLSRPGMTADKFSSILARQMTDAEKRKRADFIIDTGADLSTTEAQVRDIIACLLLRGGR
ncbi:dephospho-CoA kinase [Sphingomonas limnosediminicola]|jgi:dephospho-CoA kinase|uniref:Dephospho-CoA kinase n=1 Tax=Sphingomonas limnosediminicola TaxID=940133 RepID=A0ABP7LFT3_9SPHN